MFLGDVNTLQKLCFVKLKNYCILKEKPNRLERATGFFSRIKLRELIKH